MSIQRLVEFTGNPHLIITIGTCNSLLMELHKGLLFKPLNYQRLHTSDAILKIMF